MTITRKSDGIKLNGYRGKWYVIDETIWQGHTIYLVEHETYGDETAALAVTTSGEVICDEIYDAWLECLDDLDPNQFNWDWEER